VVVVVAADRTVGAVVVDRTQAEVEAEAGPREVAEAEVTPWAAAVADGQAVERDRVAGRAGKANRRAADRAAKARVAPVVRRAIVGRAAVRTE